MAPKADGLPDKAPRSPRTGHLIDYTNPNELFDFYECANSGYAAIGYSLMEDDDYTIIDLDTKRATEADLARHSKIRELFPSYTEASSSGNGGVHIILRGSIGGGFNRDTVEVYDRERYMICTGSNLNLEPIRAHPERLTQLVTEMGFNGRRDLPPSQPEVMSDDEILATAFKARNSAKFKDLFERVPSQYEDWSERDASFAQMIAFYTRNHDQALRLFRRSALYRPNSKGKNPQHYENYYLLERTLARAWRAEMSRDADLEHGAKLAQKIRSGQAKPEIITTNVMFPPGLVGMVADFIYNASPRPVKEIALAGALTMCSGLLGRQYNISATGLNMYIVLVAPTGRGKEAAASGVDILVNHIRKSIPGIDAMRGPSHIASGQALLRHLAKNPSMFSFLSEFGHFLKVVTDQRASASDIRTRQAMLDLFSKSGSRQTLHGTVYSDTDRNTEPVIAPCFSFMGDTTPEVYYSGYTDNMVAEGLLPRFLTIHYDGPRVPTNRHPVYTPSDDLSEKLVMAAQTALAMKANNTFTDISISSDAQHILNKFDSYCDSMINAATSASGGAEMWNRAHLKVLRIAGLIAVGNDIFNPVVRVEDVNWAVDLVANEINRFSVKLEAGDFAEIEERQTPTVVRIFKEYFYMTKDQKRSYGVPHHMKDDEITFVPYGYFRRRTRRMSEFTKSKYGAVRALKDALNDAIELGYLEELNKIQVMALPGTNQASRFFIAGKDFDKA